MLRSKRNKWGHAGTTEYALERSIPPLRHKKKAGRTSNSPPASIEQYRGNVDLSEVVILDPWEPSQVRPTSIYLNENAVSSSGA
jgi:hypothetical protein